MLRPLHTEGNQLKDDQGQVVVLRGTNVENREWIYKFPKPDGSMNIDYERRAIPVACGPGWGANLLTIAFASGPVLRGEQAYLNAMDEIISLGARQGAYTLVSWRYAEPDGEQAPGVPPADQRASLVSLARRYANNPAVLLGLQVEPHDVAWSQLVPTYSVTIASIRQTGFRGLISVPGTNWSRGVSNMLDTPILLDNLVLNCHYYDPFNVLNSQYRLDQLIARYPVVLGEFGPASGPSSGYAMSLDDVRNLLGWARTNRVSWCAWLFNSKGPPCLLTETAWFSTTAYGAVVKQELSTPLYIPPPYVPPPLPPYVPPTPPPPPAPPPYVPPAPPPYVPPAPPPYVPPPTPPYIPPPYVPPAPPYVPTPAPLPVPRPLSPSVLIGKLRDAIRHFFKLA